MDKSREEKIMNALGGSIIELAPLKSTHEYTMEAAVRQRINELLDELGYILFSHRDSVPRIATDHENRNNTIKARHYSGVSNDYPFWLSGRFSDSELPEKERDLLLWLADQLESEIKKLAERKKK